MRVLRTATTRGSTTCGLWEEWNDRFFEGILVPPLVQLAEPGQTHCYGDCSPYSGLAGIRSRIRLRPSILAGTLRDLKHGSRNKQGLRRFLEDVLLHEMIHQWHREVTGQDDAGYGGHGPAFSQKANEIGTKLGLPPVGRTRKKRDHADKGLQSPSQWPHYVRTGGFKLGAHGPSSADKPKTVSVSLEMEKSITMLRKHFDVAELCRRLAESLDS